ncbi:MAG TPA: hypothetical protein VFZ09_18825 [Archangium sp.]|uniref:hypothetical protein n=1 Tax=Archangium sp. TaxID=1872627 RepID=UPI002E330117|nr:hypothetical protein [Archangium sp.]HEX5748301.1 hypothetical protein [Archangium sp.]
MTDQQINNYARRLLVELFVQLGEKHAWFHDEEYRTVVDLANKLEAEIERGIALLDAGKELPADMWPLVKLRVVDRFLNENSGFQPTGVLAQVTLDGKRRFQVYRRPVGPRRSSVERQISGHLRAWVKHHWVIPETFLDYSVEIVRPPQFLITKLEALRGRREPLRVAIYHFEDGVEIVWHEHLLPHWQAVDLKAPETRWSRVERLLERALQAQVHVLVLPELTITPDLRRRIQGWLKKNLSRHSLLLVLPGSFHEPDPAQQGKAFNRTQLLDSAGQVVMEHTKLTRFSQGGAFESILTGSRIRLLPLPIGLMATPICLDFCQSAHPIRELWKVLGPEWLLVPAYGNQSSVNAHRAAAKDLRTSHGSRTVLANQHRQGEQSAPGFIGDPSSESLALSPEEQTAEQADAFQVESLWIWSDETSGGNKSGPGLVN